MQVARLQREHEIQQEAYDAALAEATRLAAEAATAAAKKKGTAAKAQAVPQPAVPLPPPLQLPPAPHIENCDSKGLSDLAAAFPQW